jgi:hypothetical protein
MLPECNLASIGNAQKANKRDHGVYGRSYLRAYLSERQGSRHHRQLIKHHSPQAAEKYLPPITQRPAACFNDRANSINPSTRSWSFDYTTYKLSLEFQMYFDV